MSAIRKSKDTPVQHRAARTEDGSQGLGGIEELCGGDGILVVGVNRHVSEGLLEGIQQGTAGWERRGRHGSGVVVIGEKAGEVVGVVVFVRETKPIAGNVEL